MRLSLVVTLAFSLFASMALAQTAGWEFPTTAAVTVGAADNNKVLASDNVPGSAVTVTLPNPATVGAGWNMGFRTGGGKGIIVNAPNSVYILAGQKQMTSFSAPSNDNYEFFTLQSDGTNFSLTTSSQKPQLFNGIIGAEGAQQWTYLPVTGYSATQADNGTVLASPQAGGDVTVTLPSAPLLHNAWAIRLSAWQGNSITVQVNPVQGAVIYTPAGFGSNPKTSFTVPPRSAALVSFSGTNFYISMYADNAVPVAADLTQLQESATPSAPNGIWRLTYVQGGVGPADVAPPLFYTPMTTSCPLGGGLGDNGLQVKSQDGLCWRANFPAGPWDVRQWGVAQFNADNFAQIAAALAAAADKCQTIGFPKGHFHILNQLAIPTCVGLIGSGRDEAFDPNGSGSILDFAGMPAATDAIVAGAGLGNLSKVVIQNLQVQYATKNGMTLSLTNSHVDDVSVISCAGEGIHLDATAMTRFSNITVKGNGNNGFSINGTSPADISSIILENVQSTGNTLDGFYLNNAKTVTFIATQSGLNGLRGYNIVNSRTITLIGTYSHLNVRPGYKFDGSDGTLITARAENNNTGISGTGDFVQAINGSLLGMFYGSDDVAPSGISIVSASGSRVRIIGTLLAGGRSADDSSILDTFLSGFIGTSLTFGGAFMNAGQCVVQDTTIPNLRYALANTAVASPLTYPGDGFYWQAFVPADDTVRIKLCAAVAGTPAVSAYNIRVLQ